MLYETVKEREKPCMLERMIESLKVCVCVAHSEIARRCE